MERSMLKDMLYGSIDELTRNPTYFYNSSVSPEYSHWTEKGAKELQNVMTLLAKEILRVRANDDEERSKEIVLKELKKVN